MNWLKNTLKFGEKIKSTSCGATDELVDDNASAGSGTDLTISAVKTFDVSSVKQMYMDDTAGSILDFTADCVQEARFTLTGTISLERGTDVLSGTNTLFNTELKAGDVSTIEIVIADIFPA